MVGRRKYDDGCAVAHGLDLVGERWALLVARELLLGPKRFTDLRAGIPGASPDVLTQRLRELEAAGIVRRRKLAPPAGSWVYELTAWGAELEPVILHLGRWAGRSPAMRHDAPIGVDSLILALKTLFDRDAADGLRATVGLCIGEHDFGVRIDAGRIDVVRGPAERPDVTLTADADTLSGLLWSDRDLAAATAAGEARTDGDTALAECFLTLFPTPEPAET